MKFFVQWRYFFILFIPLTKTSKTKEFFWTHHQTLTEILNSLSCLFSSLLSESTIWSYIIQLTGALRVIHSSGLACRCLDPSKVLLTGLSRSVMLSTEIWTWLFCRIGMLTLCRKLKFYKSGVWNLFPLKVQEFWQRCNHSKLFLHYS